MTNHQILKYVEENLDYKKGSKIIISKKEKEGEEKEEKLELFLFDKDINSYSNTIAFKKAGSEITGFITSGYSGLSYELKAIMTDDMFYWLKTKFIESEKAHMNNFEETINNVIIEEEGE